MAWLLAKELDQARYGMSFCSGNHLAPNQLATAAVTTKPPSNAPVSITEARTLTVSRFSRWLSLS